MSKRLLKRLSSCFKRRSVRNYRESSGAGLVQVLEVRQMLTAPTLDTLYDLTLAEDAPERSVDLTGITAGAGEVQPLRVTAVSGNTSLIAAPAVDYTTPNATGTLRFIPVANRHGSTTVTVTVEDGGPDLDLETSADNETFSRTFNVTVTPVNDIPTLNPLSDMTLSEDAPQQTVSLSGITAGGGENQPLRVTATSSNTTLIPNPTTTYTSPQATGSIRFTPAANQYGTAVITVTLEDGGLDSKLSTAGDNAIFSRTFTVTVNNINDAPSFDAISDLTISEDASEQTVNLTGIQAGPFEVQPMRISASSSNPGLIPNPAVDYTTPNATGALRLQPVANLSGTALITVVLEDGGQDDDLATVADNLMETRTFLVTVNPVNDAPTLDSVGNLSLTEDDAEQTVNLSGISAGGGESQPLRVTAASSNTALIPDPSVTYSSADATGLIRFTPVADQSGTALISVTIEDGGLDGNLGTAADNATTTRIFSVTVAAVNDAPTLNTLSDLNIDEDAAQQTVNLSGISAGGGESQALRVTASSSNTGLIPNPAVTYTSADATGSIQFTPVADQSGTALITVTVEDAGLDGDLSTATDNLTVTRTFLVTVAAVNDKPTVNTLADLQLVQNAAEQTVNLSGISAGGGEVQPLRVSAVSSNTSLIPDPATTYTSADATGSIRFTPVAATSGSAVITVTIEDGGLDGDLSTAGDNALFSVTFTVVVNDPPTLDAISDVGVSEDATEQSVGLSGISAGTGESQALRVTASSGNPALIADPVITYTSPDATASLKFTPIADQSGAAVITVTVEDAGIDANFATGSDNRTTTRTFTITVAAVNDAPTMNTLSDSTIAEDASEQTVNLSGITAGGGETQPLRVTAFSSDTSLIPDPAVTYTSAESIGSIRYTPVADQSGTATITVTVEDGGLDGDLSTSGDNLTFSRSFVVTVTAVNDAPTLDALSDLTISEDASEQTVSLAGITAGGGETQPLKVTASSSATGLIPNPSVTYTSADATGSIRFTPVADQSGTATITVTIEDGGLDGDLGTSADNGVSSRTFVVTVSAVNDVPTLDALSDSVIAEDASEQTVSLGGISAGGGESQPLKVTTSSSNTALIPTPSVSYSSANATGSIRYTPNADQNGVATITVTVEDGGLDNDLSTVTDNLTFSRTFVVTVTSVNDAPTIDQPADLTIDEDASEQTVNLTGITAGGGESQPLKVTVSSSNTSLIPIPTLTYTSPNSTGSIAFVPTADLSGTSTITLTVEDGGPDLDLGTAGDNLVTTKTFVVTVRAVNDLPTLDTLYDLTVTEDSGEATVDLSGITAGADESQTLRVSAASGDTGMIPTPSVVYTSASSTGSIKFTPAANRHGIVTITVTVEDAGLDGDINTTADNGYFSRSFPLTITPVNDAPDFDQPGNVTVSEDAPEQTVNLTGISAGPWESQPLKVTATSSDTGLVPTPNVTYATPDSTATLKFTPVADQSGTAVITVTVEDGGGDGKLETLADNVTVTKSFTVTVNAVNDVPTLDSLADATISEDASEQSVSLSGISAGGGESQPLRVTASSSNLSLIGEPTVIYTSADAVGSVKFTPIADQSGVAVITVVVEDGGLDGNLNTAGDNASVTRTFTVTVTAVNDTPTLNQPSDATIDEDASEQTVSLTGISAGGGESQHLKVTASSSNPGLIPAPTVVYTSADATGSLKYTPVADQHGVSVITIVVEDAGLDNDLSTTGDNLTVTRTFTVSVTSVNDAPTIDSLYDATISEDDGEQVVELTGISAGGGEVQSLSVTASSSNSGLIPVPTIVYTSADSEGLLKYTPVADQSGSAVITVVVEDGGPDGDLSTTGDNGTTTLSFTVTVTPVNDAPTLDDLYDATITEDAAEQTVDLTGISAGGAESQPLKVTATSSNTALIADPTVIYTSANATGTVKYTPVADQHGTAVITVVVEDGGLDGNLSTSGDNLTVTKTFTVTVTPVNDAPTLDQPADVAIDEDAGEQTVSLTGISAGGGESQPLKVTATSSDTGLIPDPVVVYSSADATGSLKYSSVLNLSGTAVITVVAEDGGLDGDLGTTGDNLTITRTFTVTVNAVNDAPTLDQPSDVTIAEDASEQTVNLSGITAGGGESQPLNVTASSSNTDLVPSASVTYVSADATGSLQFTPAADQSGQSLIVVTVEDGGPDGDLSTTSDNATTTLIFTVTVTAVNDAPTLDQPSDVTIDEDASEQAVGLTGISAGGGESQSLKVTATSSDTGLIPDPTVVYSSADAAGSLKYAPVADQSGIAVITVVVEDAGLDEDFSTTGDNLTVTRTFTVTVNAVNDVPTIDVISDATIAEDSPEQTVSLSGISAGGGELQQVRITATSDNPGLIPDPSVIYTSGDATGQLLYTPVADQNGVAVITVEVEDSGLDGDWSTTADNAKTTILFVVTVTSVNDAPTIDTPNGITIDEDAAEQSVSLTGITAGGGEGQTLKVTASSSDSVLIPDPVVLYVSADATGTLLFTPTADLSGEVVISVTVEDAGEDGDPETLFDNASTTVTFTVLINPINDVPTLDFISDLEIDEDSAELDLLITGITAGGGESQPLKVTATSENTDLIPDPVVVYSSAEEVGVLKFAPLPDQSGFAVITVLLEDGGLDGDLDTTGDNLTISRQFTVFVNPINDVPTLDQQADLVIAEDASEQTVSLTGISAGGGEAQPLNVVAVSDNSDLIPDPLVTYFSADSTGSLKFTPTPNLSGLANIYVTVTDGGLDNDLSTPDDNLSTTMVFTVVVTAINDAPTLDPVADLTIDEDAPQQLVDLSGITAGGGETQHLRVTAASSNQSLMQDPRVTYASAESTGQLQFIPLPDQNGTTIITVTIEDAGLDEDMSTRGDNATYSYSFTVTVRPINDVPLLDQPADLIIAEDAPQQTVSLTGIAAGGGESQPLRVTATSSNTTLIPAVSVDYLTPAAVGSVRFTPTADLSGTSVITVVLEDGGDDGDLATAGDNLTVTRTFTVTVTPVNDIPTINQPADLTIAEDAPQQTVTLTGITAGGGESQPLKLTVSSSNTTLIATPTVSYLTPNSSGSISFTPTADLSGTALIVLTVEDGGLDGDLATAGDNLTVMTSFTVTVTPVNDTPLLNQPSNLTIAEDAAQQTVNLSGIAAGGGETQPLRVTAISSNTGLIPNPTVTYTSASATGSIAFTPVADQNGSAVITVTVTDGGLDGDLATPGDNLSFSRSFTVTVTPVNDAPLMDALSDLTIAEDAPLQTVSLTGIAAGGGENQPLKVTVSSSNAGLIPTPALSYVSPNATGSITFAPVANLSGSAVITVVLEDGGGDGDLATAADNLSVTRTFAVTVTAVNDAPTLDALADVTFDEDSSQQTLNLRGISAGGGENQPLRVTASSSNTGVIPNPTIVYTSADATGLIRFTPAPDQSGVAVLTVQVEDGGPDGNLSTTGDNGVFNRSFTVTVNPLNDAPTLSPLSNLTIFEDSTEQTVNLSGITAGGGESQPLNVTAVSSNAGLIPTPSISYTSADSTGTLRFTPTARTTGVSTITVTLEDGGLDQDLSTTADNRTFSRSFSVTVQAIRPVIVSPIGSTPAQRPTFIWTSVPGAASYKVWVKNVSTGANPFHQATSVSTVYQMPFNLGIGKFDVYVQAVFATGAVSDWSSINRFTVVTPVSVSSLAQRQATYRPTLTWLALPGASKYEIWLDNRSTGQSQVYRTFVTTTSWTPDADLQLSRYRFWARGIAVDGTPAGWSPQTDFLVVTPPQPVTPLSSTFDRQQTFTWTTVLGATSYGVYLQNTSNGAVVANVSGLPTPSWTPTVALADGNYAWWSIAESAIAGFRSDWSVRTDFYVGGRPVVTGPTGQVATLRPTIRWADVVGAGKYDVWLNRTFGNQIDFNVFKQFGVTGNSLQVPADLVNGAEYRVWVRAVSTTDEVSPWSNPQDFSVFVASQQDSVPQPAGSGDLQLLAVEPAVVQIPQLQSTLAAEPARSERAVVSVRRAEQDELEIERATILAAAAQQVHSAAAVEADDFGADSAVDQSIQDIVEALLSGGLNLS
jgi:hypothetical protein